MSKHIKSKFCSINFRKLLQDLINLMEKCFLKLKQVIKFEVHHQNGKKYLIEEFVKKT